MHGVKGRTGVLYERKQLFDHHNDKEKYKFRNDIMFVVKRKG